MVIKINSLYAAHTSRAPPSPPRRHHHPASLLPLSIRASHEESDSEDVIDLGAPRGLLKLYEKQSQGSEPRRRRVHTPNPRLYPPPPRPKRRGGPRGAEKRARRRRARVFRRVVPNPRLYRPAPARPPPPPLRPRAAWSPPEPAARLHTASYVALRLADDLPRASFVYPPAASPVRRSDLPSGFGRRGSVPAGRARAPRCRGTTAARRGPAPAPYSAGEVEHGLYAAPQARSRRLVVTLPQPSLAERPPGALQHYRPASAHFRSLSLDTDTDSGTCSPESEYRSDLALAMDSGKRHSASPEDRSEGNESAPSEFLAEFLSAIMRRQYAEALKYCRLILQYEPHNATARGFYPLLEHKTRNIDLDGARGRTSSSDEASAPPSEHSPPALAPPSPELMEQGGDDEESSASEASGASCGSQSSLELDSSEAAAQWSCSASPSRRTERSDSASAGRWDSSGASRSEDDNGNAAAPAAATSPPAATATATPAAVESSTDNASLASLRRLRAQFTCSIK